MQINDSHGESEGYSQQVRTKLLDTAEKLFAEQGFDGASIRQITAEAGCNVAAVNYHFGGKDKLYLEVFRRLFRNMAEVRTGRIEKAMSGQGGEVSLEGLLKDFAKDFLGPLLKDGSGAVELKLMVREMQDRRLPKEIFAEELAEPTVRSLSKALRRFCPYLEDTQMLFCIYSLIGQLVHIIHAREMFAHGTSTDLQAPEISEWLDHVVRFTVAGIKGYEQTEG